MYYFNDEGFIGQKHHEAIAINTGHNVNNERVWGQCSSVIKAKEMLKTFNDNWKSRAFRQEIMRRLKG